MVEFGKRLFEKQKNLNHRAWNDLVKRSQQPAVQPPEVVNCPRDYDLVHVENSSGYDTEAFGVLRVDTATWQDRDDSGFQREGLRRGVELSGTVPVDEWDNVAVNQQANPNGGIFPGVISGPTPCRVLFPDAASLDYPFAIPIPGDPAKLKASPFGLNRILWHAAPETAQTGCDPRTLQAYVNMGEDGQWVFFKLRADLSCCGSASALLVDECGAQIGECPVIQTIWAPQGLNLCACANDCTSWKTGDVVPCWWYQYLEKWVTIPDFTANLEMKSKTVLTSVSFSGVDITPTDHPVNCVTGMVFDTSKIELTDWTPQSVTCTGGFELENASASGNVSLSGTLAGSIPFSLPITSACDGVTLSGTTFSTVSAELAGTLETTAALTVSTRPAAISTTGTIEGTATGTVTTSGTVSTSGSATLSGTLQAQKAVTLNGVEKTFSRITQHTLPALATRQIALTIPQTSGTITGALNASGAAVSIPISGLTVTLDLSALFETQDVEIVDGFENCALVHHTETVVKLKSGASLSAVSASVSGNLAIPSEVSGTCALSAQSDVPAIGSVTSWSAGNLEWTDETVNIPTSGTLNLNETVNVSGTVNTSGSAELSGSAQLDVTGTCTASGTVPALTGTGTATISAPVTVSGDLNLSGTSIAGTLTRDCAQYAAGTLNLSQSVTMAGNVNIPVTGEINGALYCTVPVPTSVTFNEGTVTLEVTPISQPTLHVEGGTITGNSETISYLGCRDCPE